MADINLTAKLTGDFTQILDEVKKLQSSLNKLNFKDKNFGREVKQIVTEMKLGYEEYIKLAEKGTGTKREVERIKQLQKELEHLSASYGKAIKSIDSNRIGDIFNIDNVTETEIQNINKQMEAAKNLLTNGAKAAEQYNKALSALGNINTAKFGDKLRQYFESFKAGDLENSITNIKKAISAREQDKQYAKSANAKTRIGDEIKNAKILLAALKAVNNYKGVQILKTGEAEKAKLMATALSAVETELEGLTQDYDRINSSIKSTGSAFLDLANTELNARQEMERLVSQVQYFFGIQNSINLFKRLLRSAFNTVKELDKAMTETAVVTNFSVGDMWEALPRYTEAANKLGTTTLGAYETMTLYYQQGLETNEVFEIGTETMKMARIAGLEYAEATDLNHWVA